MNRFDTTFEKWFEAFVDHLRLKKNFKDVIDKDIALDDYALGYPPEVAADSYYEDMRMI